jgi:hypothetical protein
MTHPSPAAGPTARRAGAAYLLLIAAGIFAEFFVRSQLVVPGEASATAANIAAQEGLFRWGITGDLIMLLCDVFLAWAFYVLLKPVSRNLALLAAFFRLVHAAIYGANLLNLFFVLQLSGGPGFLAPFAPDQIHALMLMFMGGHATGYLIGLVFFGVYCLILGRLVMRSELFPAVLGVLLMVAGVGYLIDSFAQVLYAGYQDHAGLFQAVVFTPAFVGEMAFALYLLIKGTR